MGLTRRYAASVWIWHADCAAKGYEVFARASRIGFDAIEIPTFDGNLDTPLINKALNSLASSRRRLEPVVIGGGSAGTDLTSNNLAVRRNAVKYMKNCVEGCSAIGGSLVCGPLYAAVGRLEHLTERQIRERYNEVSRSFKEIARFAREEGVRIALEPLCRYDTSLLNTVTQGRNLVDAIDEENVGLLLDTFHLNIEEKSIAAAIRRAGSKLFHFHACENDRGTPGSGSIRWEEVASGLDEIHYDKLIAIESFTPYDRNFSSTMKVWRPLADDQDALAAQGLAFLKAKLSH